ncbi:hypothetical protein [Paenibacillus flagellatus]|uniref:DUF5668 domain-containing protein n=1 Tax=Paenibacillus flagellatus TaxID=2211139 RepID=A0A2V5KZR3_9BACL|nr:hypothetical protein [Paenibacillus flagellatus]PYI55696.1 hypothetical protein DLM86_08185 [Paenibacillus flagellatus]
MKFRAIAGAVLMLLGAYLFLNRGDTYGPGTIFAYFWPSLFVIPLGLFFHWMYFSMVGRKGIGLLIPGGILFTSGIVCQISMIFDSWGTMWPGFIMAVAVGLFEFYWFGGRNKWLLIPINILVVLSVLFFVVFSAGAVLGRLAGQPLAAVAILVLGALLLVGRKKET